MGDYIKRKDVLKIYENEGAFDYITPEDIMKIPSADVLKVVRCKNCKYNKAKDKSKGICGFMVYIHNADDYCSCGERKE